MCQVERTQSSVVKQFFTKGPRAFLSKYLFSADENSAPCSVNKGNWPSARRIVAAQLSPWKQMSIKMENGLTVWKTVIILSLSLTSKDRWGLVLHFAGQFRDFIDPGSQPCSHLHSFICSAWGHTCALHVACRCRSGLYSHVRCFTCVTVLGSWMKVQNSRGDQYSLELNAQITIWFEFKENITVSWFPLTLLP